MRKLLLTVAGSAFLATGLVTPAQAATPIRVTSTRCASITVTNTSSERMVVTTDDGVDPARGDGRAVSSEPARSLWTR